MPENDSPVVVINTFTPKPGKLDEFVETQIAGLQRLTANGPIPGSRGGRFFRSLDGATAVLVSVFDSVDAQKQFLKTEAFGAHRDRLAPLIDHSDARFYELVYETATPAT